MRELSVVNTVVILRKILKFHVRPTHLVYALKISFGVTLYHRILNDLHLPPSLQYCDRYF